MSGEVDAARARVRARGIETDVETKAGFGQLLEDKAQFVRGSPAGLAVIHVLEHEARAKLPVRRRIVQRMADPIWQRSEDLFLFHHTTPESAEQIATSGVYRIGPAKLPGPRPRLRG